MDDITQRVLHCFATVFPDVAPDALQTLSQDTCEAWDSLAHATLIAALGEELGLELDFEAFAEASSFERMLAQVKAALGKR